VFCFASTDRDPELVLNKNVGSGALSYQQMNEKASEVAIGSDGLSILPFGMVRNGFFKTKTLVPISPD
jgi:xylulokinase